MQPQLCSKLESKYLIYISIANHSPSGVEIWRKIIYNSNSWMYTIKGSCFVSKIILFFYSRSCKGSFHRMQHTISSLNAPLTWIHDKDDFINWPYVIRTGVNSTCVGDICSLGNCHEVYLMKILLYSYMANRSEDLNQTLTIKWCYI